MNPALACGVTVLDAAFVDDKYCFEVTVRMGSNALASSTILHWRKLKRPEKPKPKIRTQRRIMLAVVPERMGWKAIADPIWIEVFYCLHKSPLCVRRSYSGQNTPKKSPWARAWPIIDTASDARAMTPSVAPVSASTRLACRSGPYSPPIKSCTSSRRPRA